MLVTRTVRVSWRADIAFHHGVSWETIASTFARSASFHAAPGHCTGTTVSCRFVSSSDLRTPRTSRPLWRSAGARLETLATAPAGMSMRVPDSISSASAVRTGTIRSPMLATHSD